MQVESTVASAKPEKKKTFVKESAAAPETVTVAAADEPDRQSEAAAALPAKKSLWVRFKHEVLHYVSGFKLLYLDVKGGDSIDKMRA